MDFLEDLFELGRREYKKSGGVFHDQYRKDRDDDHDDDDDDDNKRRRYPTTPYAQAPASPPQVTSTPVAFLSNIVCRRCSTQTVQGAKFCHGCGTAVELILKCASCGSKLPVNEPVCSQCGYGN